MKFSCFFAASFSVILSNLAIMAQQPAPALQSTSAAVHLGQRSTLPIALETLPESTRMAVNKIMLQPTIKAAAPMEEFASTGDMYLWLLDHPDRVSLAWRRLKVEAVEIKMLRDGGFYWSDGQGSELTWHTIGKSGDGRIWLAEGKIRVGLLLPISIPVKAVAVLHHGIRKKENESKIRHQVDVYLQTDSKAASMVSKILGPAAPRMAVQGAEQLQIFFSGIARYVDHHPQSADVILAGKK